MAAVTVAGAVGCGPAHSADSPGTAGPPAATRTDVPEPATAPPVSRQPAGTVRPLPGEPEGLAVDARDAVLAAGVRAPDGVALLDTSTGRELTVVRLAGAPRHLALAGPAGPLLVPLEQTGQLVQVALPAGRVLTSARVGRQPHDAAAVGSLVFVGNEFSNTVSLVHGGRQVAVEPGPLQPGGVAAAADGSSVVVVGVRGRRIEAYTAAGRALGTAPAGAGSTHVAAGPGGLFYVADTEGDDVLVYSVTGRGPRLLGQVATKPGTPYGIAVDSRRTLLYVTLTATNELESFRISGRTLVPGKVWPTVRQPNSVAIDEATGRVFVASRTDNQLELIDPGTPGS
jgi:DNA-binding beta-propeller fold protein YncE